MSGGWRDSLWFAVIELLCIAVFVLGLKNLTPDEDLLRPDQR